MPPRRRRAIRPSSAIAALVLVMVLVPAWRAAAVAVVAPASPTGGAIGASAVAPTLSSPDPRFLRLERRPPAGVPHRLAVRTDLELRVRLERPGGGPAEEIVLEGGHRLDAEVTVTDPATDGAAGPMLRLRIVDGEHRPPGGGVRRLPVGRTFEVRSRGGDDGVDDAIAGLRLVPADGEAPLEADAVDALLAALAAAGLTDEGRGEAAALGLHQPRAIGERWRPDGPGLAALAGLSVDGGPPAPPATTATASRTRPIDRRGRTVDHVELQLDVRATPDLAIRLLRELGGRGPVGEGSATLRSTLLLPRAGGPVAERRTRTVLEARAAGEGDVPPARLAMTAETVASLRPADPAAVDAAIARARARTEADPDLVSRTAARAASWGLAIDGWTGDGAWTLRDPRDSAAILEAVRSDGVAARILRPDVVGRHGFSLTGLDLAAAASLAAPGHRLGEPFELGIAPRRLRARFGRRPGGERWTVSGFADERPVVLVLDVPEGGPLLDRAELQALHARVSASDAGGPGLEAPRRAIRGSLRLSGPGGRALPPAWLGMPGADLAAAGPGWRVAAWTVPFTLPAEATLLMLDAAAGETGFERRPDAGELTLEPVRRLGRGGRAAVTPTARLEVVRGEDDVIVLLAVADDDAATRTMDGALARLVLTAPIESPRAPRDADGDALTAAGTLDAAAAAEARIRRAAELVNAYGTRLMRIDEPTAAAEAFAAATRLDPGATLGRLNRALALAEAGRLMAAAALIDGDAELRTVPAARRLRARISLEAGEARDAVRRYEALLADVPDPEAAANLVVAIRQVDGPAAARARGRAWMDAHGEHAMVLLSMSIVAADAGDPRAALSLVERAIDLAPGDASLRPFRDRYRSLVGEAAGEAGAGPGDRGPTSPPPSPPPSSG